jgi:hypothetical protein
MMTTSSPRWAIPGRSLSERDARVLAAALLRVKRCAAMGWKEPSMIFLWALLGSMIVCEALICGNLQRALATTARDFNRWQEHVAALLAANGYYEMGRDYRWE